MRTIIYLDSAATTKPSEEAVAAAEHAMTKCWGNPSASYSAGREAKNLLDSARLSVAKALGGRPEELVFTSGGTEADNQAVIGAARKQKHRGRHIISSLTEHEAVLEALKYLGSEGYEITLLSPDKSGAVSVSAVEEALKEDTILVSLMLVNNETGAVNPISRVASLIKAKGSSALLHTDAVQAFKKIPFSVKSLGADLVALSAHKIHGIKGAGALWVREGVKLNNFIHGGGQEKGSRSGTEAMPAIAAFGAAADVIFKNNYSALRQILINELPEAVFIGEDTAAHINCLSLPGCKAEVLATALDGQGIYVSRGSACTKGRRSHVLTAMGLAPELIDGALRISFSEYTTEEEVYVFCKELKGARDRYFPKSKK
jgi:cysteine desulfurase